MVKTPRTRHSTSKKEPVTIDLEAVRDDPQDEAPPAETNTATASPASDETQPIEAEQATSTSDTAEATDAQAEAAYEASAESAGGGSDLPPDAPAYEAEAYAPPPGTDAKPSSRSGGGAVLGGLVGGVVALLLAGGLQYAGVIPPLNDGRQEDAGVDALRQEIAAVQSEIADLRTAEPASSGPSLDEALAGPRQQIAELRETVQSLEQQVSSGASPAQSEALAALEQRRNELEAAFNDLSQRMSESGSADGELARRVEAAEAELAGLRETAQSAGDAGREAATEASAEAVSAVTARIDEVAGTIEALSGRLDELAAEVARQDEGPKVALVVAASSLKSAVDRGAPFASELETYSSLATNAADFDQLRAYAERGIPTLATLTEEATALASRIAAAENAPDASAGFVDRLMSSARSVVNVRPVGEVAGEEPSAIAARMEAAVQRGDLDAAIAQYESLPPTMKELGADFAEKLRARQAAEDILDQALSSALKPA